MGIPHTIDLTLTPKQIAALLYRMSPVEKAEVFNFAADYYATGPGYATSWEPEALEVAEHIVEGGHRYLCTLASAVTDVCDKEPA